VAIVGRFPPGAFQRPKTNHLGTPHLAAELPKGARQPVVVENRPGGNTIIATRYGGQVPRPTDTTFRFGPPAASVLSGDPEQCTRTSFDRDEGLRSPSRLDRRDAQPAWSPTSSAPVTTNGPRELIAYASLDAKRPGKINYATPGKRHPRTISLLSMELFKSDGRRPS